MRLTAPRPPASALDSQAETGDSNLHVHRPFVAEESFMLPAVIPDGLIAMNSRAFNHHALPGAVSTHSASTFAVDGSSAA